MNKNQNQSRDQKPETMTDRELAESIECFDLFIDCDDGSSISENDIVLYTALRCEQLRREIHATYAVRRDEILTND